MFHFTLRYLIESKLFTLKEHKNLLGWISGVLQSVCLR